MTIAVQTLFDDAVDDFGAEGSDKFETKFPRAINRSLSLFSVRADLDTSLAHIIGISSTISDMDAEEEYMLYQLVRFFLVRMGERPGDPRLAKAFFEDTRKDRNEAIADFIQRRSNEDQDTSTNDIAVLGDVS